MQDVGALPAAWHSVGPELCGPHGTGIVTQQNDAFSDFTYRDQDQLNTMQWEMFNMTCNLYGKERRKAKSLITRPDV
jgi:hypothetical protein